MRDYIIQPYYSFKDKLKYQRELKNEMRKRFGVSKPNDWKYTITTLDNCIFVEHKSLTTHF